MTERWLLAGLFIVAGLLLGAIAGWYVRRRLIGARGGDATSSIAGATGLFVFWIIALAGAVAAVAMVNPETLEDVPRQLLDYTPRLLLAGLILLAGNALALGVSGIVSYGMERASGRAAARLAALVRWTIIGAAAILALAQLGVDTTLLIILVAVAGGGTALAAALLIGFGGRDIAREIAAGRYLRRFVATGATIETRAERGKIAALHPATAELETASGARRHVPYSHLLDGGVTIGSGEATAEEGNAG